MERHSSGMQESIDRFRTLARTTEEKAVLNGLAVFAVLYLHVAASSYAIGMTFGGASLIKALLWPLFGLLWFAVQTLAVFGGVAFYIYWLKRGLLRAEEMEARAAHWKTVSEDSARRWSEEMKRREEAEARAAEARAGAGSGNDEALRKAEARAAAAEKRAAAAEARAAAAEAVKGNPNAGGGTDKLREAKRTFARLYHPDNVHGSGIDKMVRAEIFKEFWRELERIEKS